jgi:superfamily II DNA or RNA helicase
MPTRRIIRPNLELKTEIEAEIKAAEDADVALEVAEDMLDSKSIDQDFRKLQRKVSESAFKFHARDEKHDLRPYQKETLANLSRLYKEKVQVMAVQLPTGAGKTFLIHSFIYERLLKKSKNVLVVAPSWEIANQHAATVCQQFKDGTKRVRRLGGRGQLIAQFDEYKKSDKGKVIITTCALFYARQTKLREFLKAGLVVIDEGHHGYKKKRLNSIQTFARELKIPLVLLTATPPQIMQNLPFAAQLKYLDLVPDYLVKCKVVRLDTGEEFDPVLKNGVLSQSSRVELSSRRARYEKIVAQSERFRAGQAIYYAGSVSEAMGVLKEYETLGVPAVAVHSKWVTKGDKINALAIERFRSGKAQVLVNVQMLAMGFDVPNV